MLVRLVLVVATVSGTLSISSGEDTLYTGVFTSKEREGDIASAIELCETDLACAGVSLSENGDVTDAKLHHHSFVGTYKSARTYETTKPYIYHRGRIVDGTVLDVAEEITVADAKDQCSANPECVAFTYPVRSLVGLRYPPNVTFVSTVESFFPSEDDQWRTYVSNDHRKVERIRGTALPYSENVSEVPFRRCCRDTIVPPIKEIEAADSLERISCDISREEFFLQYEVLRKPVMLVGCEKDWPAVTEWTYEKLTSRFSNESKWRAYLGPYTEDFNDETPWEDIINAMRNSTPFYVFHPLDDGDSKAIDNDYKDPIPLAGNDLYRNIPEFSSLRWFCIGKFGSGSQPHVDPFATDAWNTLIRGHKWWIVWPQGYTNSVEVDCEPGCSIKPEPLIQHWYASVGANAARTEVPIDKYAYHVLQKPGETIYVPGGIIHSVFNMDSTIAITKNFASQANLKEVWKETVEDGQEMKWKIMYNQNLNKAQRRLVRQGKFWPPWKYRVEEGEDHITGYARGNCDDYVYDEDWFPEEGELIEAQYDAVRHNSWYPAYLTRARHDSYNVKYFSGRKESGLPRRAIRKYAQFRKYDRVEVRMRNQGEEKWVQAGVTAADDDGMFSILCSDGVLVKNLSLSELRRHNDPWNFSLGEAVVYQVEGDDDIWYSGYVKRLRRNGRYDIRFDDGDVATCVGAHQLEPA